MKTKAKIFLMAMVTFLLSGISSCTRPDRVNDNSEYCNSGQSVLTIDDSYITSAVRNKIYKPFTGSGIISTTDSKYNAQGRCIVIPFDMTDLPWNTAVDTTVIKSAYFGTGNSSFSDFFYENSYGQFKLTNVAVSQNVVHFPFAMTQWGVAFTNESLFTYLCEHAIIPWSLVDQNGDHNITQNEVQIIFTYANGAGGMCRPATIDINSNLTGGMYHVVNRFGVMDCKRNDASDKAVNPVAFNSTVCHELGHCFFGLPDRYGNSGVCATGSTGPYDMMADNCSWKHFSIYDKMKIGWVTPKILEQSANRPDHARKCFQFPASETSPAAVVLWTASAPDEFYIIENRYAPASTLGFESGFRENGLAVWWASTTDDVIHLVSFKTWGHLPATYNYDDPANADGAMFVNKHEYGATVPIILKSSNNYDYFSFRAISPAGAMMCAEL